MPVLVYGPRSEFIHGFDERVRLQSLRNVTKATVLFMANWCSLAAVPRQMALKPTLQAHEQDKTRSGRAEIPKP